jgi:two-component system, OmpR family, phosphate regulon sensor histidine kinase PhoR
MLGVMLQPDALAVQGVAEGAQTSDTQVIGWIVACAILSVWILSSYLRRRSAARLSRAVLEEAESRIEDTSFLLLGSLSQDVLRRLRHERERRDRIENRLHEIERVLRATPIAVLALDHLQRVIGSNPAAEKLLKFDERSARGRLLQEVVRQPTLNRAVARALAADGQLHDELQLDFDSPLEIQISCEPLQTEGHPAGLVISLVDVTRMRRLESMRSEFASNVSHELRTPITNIKGYVETLLSVDLEDTERRRKFLEIIHRNTLRLSGIVEDILTLAFLEEPEARTALVLAPMPVGEVAREVVDALGSAAAARSIQIEVAIDEHLIIEANRSLLEQALTNLVSNAVRYSGEGTRVRVFASIEEGNVRIAVQDQGAGIASKHLPRLFERFYRVDKARARTQGGTGLGLAIVKHIATIHGGSVEVVSQVGTGSCFSLLLPCRQDVPTARAAG